MGALVALVPDIEALNRNLIKRMLSQDERIEMLLEDLQRVGMADKDKSAGKPAYRLGHHFTGFSRAMRTLS